MYGTLFAITASGNSQPVANTPAPGTELILENPPADTGALMLVLSTELITSCPTDPVPKSTRSAGVEYDPPFFTDIPLNARFDIAEPCCRITPATALAVRMI